MHHFKYCGVIESTKNGCSICGLLLSWHFNEIEIKLNFIDDGVTFLYLVFALFLITVVNLVNEELLE